MKDELRKSIFEMIANDSPGSEIIPNFSALARRIGVDRHTLSDHWRNGYPTYDPSKPRKSKFDGYTAEISDAYTKTSCVMAVFQYMRNKYPQVFTSYTAFKSFSDSRGLRPANVKVPHVRFETEEGFQVQVDWKEDMKMILKDGTVIEFNIFVLTFSSSRMHYFEFSIHKTFEEICRCFLAVFQRAGGVPRSMLTDNMATLLDYDKEDFTAEAKQFFKDVGFEPTRC
jgi:transposase